MHNSKLDRYEGIRVYPRANWCNAPCTFKTEQIRSLYTALIRKGFYMLHIYNYNNTGWCIPKRTSTHTIRGELVRSYISETNHDQEGHGATIRGELVRSLLSSEIEPDIG